jgi:hypothetical protein
MQVGHSSNSASSLSFAPTPTSAAAVSATHRSYIPSLIPPGVDPAKVDSKMFYTYVPNTIKTRKRTTPAQLEILEGVFVTDKKPNAPRRKELAKKLKMSPREVQVCPLLRPLAPKIISSRVFARPIITGVVSEQACQREESQWQSFPYGTVPHLYPYLYRPHPCCPLSLV